MTYSPMYSRQRADFVAATEAQVQPLVTAAEAAQAGAEEARDQVVTNTLKRVNLWPDPLFREIAPTGNYLVASGKARRRLFGTWEKVKSAQSPYASGFSMKLAAGCGGWC